MPPMARLEVLKFSRDIVSLDEAPDGISLEVTEFPGAIALTTVDHPDNPRLGTTVGIFVPDELPAWTVMSRFQETSGNIIRLSPTAEGELTFDGTPIPVGAHVTIQEKCTIVVRYQNDEGGWR